MINGFKATDRAIGVNVAVRVRHNHIAR